MISDTELSLARPATKTTVLGSACAVYFAALAQGLTVVSFPASGALFKARGFTDSQYGALFLPQVCCTLIASLLGARLAARLGLARLLGLAALASAIAAVLLYVSSIVPLASAFLVLLMGTGMMGAGFGLSAAPLNTLPPRLFPRRADSALLALHTVMGLGFALGPWLAGEWIRAGCWPRLPIGLALFNLGLFGLARRALANIGQRSQPAFPAASATGVPTSNPAFWAFVAVAVLYAFAEGTFSNWAILYLHEERGLNEASAGLTVSLFWGGLVVGRLLSALLVLRVAAERLWLSLPVVMIGAFIGAAAVHTEGAAFGVFALAGLSCSALFPLTVTLASRRFPAHAAEVSAAMIASLMSGVGLASFSIGPLRAVLSLSEIYRASVVYPLFVFAVAAALIRCAPTMRPRI